MHWRKYLTPAYAKYELIYLYILHKVTGDSVEVSLNGGRKNAMLYEKLVLKTAYVLSASSAAFYVNNAVSLSA